MSTPWKFGMSSKVVVCTDHDNSATLKHTDVALLHKSADNL